MDEQRLAVRKMQDYISEHIYEEISIEELAKEVIAGKWGNYPERKTRLESAGYNYSEVQRRVNELVSGNTKKYIQIN